MTRAQLDKEPHDVAAMFDDVARRYDLTNDVLSLGQTRHVAAGGRVARSTRSPGERILDLAAGTGTSSDAVRATRAPTSSRATSRSACSRVGKRRQPGLAFTAGDALRLPFADATLRRGDHLLRAAQRPRHRRGARRAAAGHPPGGRLVVCEFSHPTWAPFRTVYVEYLMRALPRGRPRRQLEPGRLRLPGRVDPGLARPAGAGRRLSGPAGTGSPGATSRGIVALHRAPAAAVSPVAG